MWALGFRPRQEHREAAEKRERARQRLLEQERRIQALDRAVEVMQRRLLEEIVRDRSR